MSGPTDFSSSLIFAIGHEVGNHLGGIRLQAHLLDEDLDARELAEASVTLDDLAGRAGPLLSLMRPILAEEWRASSGSMTWARFLGGIQRQLEDEGTRGVRLELKGLAEESSDGPEVPDLEWLHPLLIAVLGSTIASVERRGAISIGLETDGDEIALVIDDDAKEEDLSPDAALRGRPLAVAIARELLGRIGGRVESTRGSGRTSLRLIFPASL